MGETKERGSGSRGAAAIESRIRDAIASIPPIAGIHGSTIQLVEFRGPTGVAVLHMEGGCADPSCEVEARTFMEGIAAHLKLQVPEIREVRVKGDEGAGG